MCPQSRMSRSADEAFARGPTATELVVLAPELFDLRAIRDGRDARRFRGLRSPLFRIEIERFERFSAVFDHVRIVVNVLFEVVPLGQDSFSCSVSSIFRLSAFAR